jgi:Fe-S cluster assembly protein SufB/Fe-S cluster assembly protein SufD
LIEVEREGGQTNAYLSQHILMLDRTAKVDAVPALEIKTNDVKASHAATVTKVSEEDLFYMASRGIGRDEARALYVRGFLGDLLMGIGHADMRAAAEEALGRRLR